MTTIIILPIKNINLPKGIDEALNMKTIRKSQKEQEEEDITITNQETYEKMQDREIKNRPDTTLRNIQQQFNELRNRERLLVNEEKKKKYYVFNGFKHYV